MVLFTMNLCINQNVASIASVGFSFCALVVGVIPEYLKYDEAKRIATKTLDTILMN